MPGIEFVGADAGGDADDDVLDTGPRRPVPRWVWVVAFLAVVAVGIGVLVSSRSDGSPTARPSPSAPTSAGPSADDVAPVEQISVLTADGTSLFWVAGQRLHRAGPSGRSTSSVAISPTGGDFAELQLVADPAEQTIWVVSHGSSDSTGASGNVEGFATGDLTRVVRASARSLISGAAVLDSALYVLAAGRLLRITSRATGFTTVAAVDRHATGLVADPSSLLFVEGGNGSALGRWTPDGGVQRPVVLDATEGALAVVGATIFFLGTRGGHDTVDTLTPAGRVVRRNVPTGLVGGLQPVATGEEVLLVLGRGANGLQLSCLATDRGVDAPTPEAVAVAPSVSANVAVLQGEVFQAVGGTVRPVSFGDNVCPG